jgi:hypothetical protein
LAQKNIIKTTGYNVTSIEEMKNIIRDLQELQNCKVLGLDEYRTYELAYNFNRYARTDWTKAVSSKGTERIAYLLANCYARAWANFYPGKFKRELHKSGLPVAEQFEIDTQDWLDVFNADEFLADMIVDLYYFSDAIAEREENEEWESFRAEFERTHR